MITYLLLGHHGRLGNQMFQYAMLLGVSKKNNYLMAIPQQNHSLKECFNITCKSYNFSESLEKIIKNMNFYREKYFHFNENIFSLKDNIIYSGNFQSEKYFKHVEQEIRQQFSFKQEIQEKTLNFINKIKSSNNKKLVSVHVRRGDYLAAQHIGYHPVQTLDWYEKCFSRFGNDFLYVVFSDDIEWCKENFKNNNFVFSDLKTNYEDLCAMSMCDHHIIANSSFSWWGAWLNPKKDKRVIAPKLWFGEKYNYHNLKDLYCDDWEII